MGQKNQKAKTHDTSEESFVKLKLIGKGAYSRVFLVQKRDNLKYYAMKVMKKDVILNLGDLKHIRTERIVLECLNHPYIVKLRYSFQSETELFLVMDFINGGELYYHLVQERRFSEDRVKIYCAEIFLALDHLHQHNIIYRDLKLENILLDKDGHCVLTDFNFSKIITNNDSRASTFCGTVDYIAPEILLIQDQKNTNDQNKAEEEDEGEIIADRRESYNFSVDWWALGILCYELLFGLPPFYSTDISEAYHNILTKPLMFPNFPVISKQCKDFIKNLLRRNESKRLGSKSSDEIRNHPWFLQSTEDNFFDLVEKKKHRPLFLPQLSGADDVKYIDNEFLQQGVVVLNNEESPDSPRTPTTPIEILQQQENMFEGFSFSGTSSCTSSPNDSDSHHQTIDIENIVKSLDLSDDEEEDDERQKILELVSGNGRELGTTQVEEMFRGDSEIVTVAVRQNGFALDFASEDLKNNKQVVVEAVRQHGWAIQYASEELKNDREVVMESMMQNNESIIFVGEEIIKKSLVLEKLKEFDGDVYECYQELQDKVKGDNEELEDWEKVFLEKLMKKYEM